MSAQLIPAGGGQPILLHGDTVTIGRAPECDVVIRSRAVSARHCLLQRRDGYWWVTDLDSRNGVGVNGVRCRRKKILPDDVLCLPKCRFQVSYDLPDDAETHNMSDDSLAFQVLTSSSAKTPESSAGGQKVTEGQADAADASQRPGRLRKVRSARRSSEKTATESQPDSPVAKPSIRTNATRFRGKLVPEGGGAPVPLLSDSVVIGRSRSADVRIKLATVSSRHCQLTWDDGYWLVEDLNSSNGIKVNGVRVDRQHLMPGDQISVSSVRYTIDYEPVGEPPPMVQNLTSKSLLEKAGLEKILDSDDAPGWLKQHDDDSEAGRRRYNLDDFDP